MSTPTETKPQKKKALRRYYDASFKMKVMDYATRHGNRAAGKRFDVDESNIRRWKNNYEHIRFSAPKRKALTGPRRGRFHEVEEIVLNWVQEQRQKCFPVSRKSIKIKALREARQRNIPRAQFKASDGWCRRMMRRSGLTLRRRTTISQKLPSDYTQKLIEFQRYVINLRKLHDYSLAAIGNADETPVFYDMPSNNTVNNKGEKTVTIRTTGHEKLRVTVMLAALADGTKLPPYVILKRKTTPKETLPNGLLIRCQEKGWMTSDLMNNWIQNVWNRRPNAAAQKNSMLVLDTFKGHITDTVKRKLKTLNTDLVVIPGGMTSILQVMDVVINKPFKEKLRDLYSDWLIETNHVFTKAGNIKKPSVSTLCEWILKAWDGISKESIIMGFKKCCISNALDGTEDDILWQQEDFNGAPSTSRDRNVETEQSTNATDSDNEDSTSDSDCEKIVIEATTGDENTTDDESLDSSLLDSESDHDEEDEYIHIQLED